MTRSTDKLRSAVAMVMRAFPDAVILYFSPRGGAFLATDLVSFRVWPDGLVAARLPDGSFVRFEDDEGGR